MKARLGLKGVKEERSPLKEGGTDGQILKA